MAHELTHTVQQGKAGSGVQMQRQEGLSDSEIFDKLFAFYSSGKLFESAEYGIYVLDHNMVKSKEYQKKIRRYVNICLLKMDKAEVEAFYEKYKNTIERVDKNYPSLLQSEKPKVPDREEKNLQRIRAAYEADDALPAMELAIKMLSDGSIKNSAARKIAFNYIKRWMLTLSDENRRKLKQKYREKLMKLEKEFNFIFYGEENEYYPEIKDELVPPLGGASLV